MIRFPKTDENELTNNLDDKPITSCLQSITSGVHRKLHPSWGVGVIAESFGRFGPHVKLQMTRFFFLCPISTSFVSSCSSQFGSESQEGWKRGRGL